MMESIVKHPVPPKGNARHIAQPENTRNPIPGTTTKPSRRKLLGAGGALVVAGTIPAAAAPAPDADAELIRLADLAVAANRQYCANLSGEVDVLPEVDAELERLSLLADDCYRRAAEIPATTHAGRRAKAKIVTLANSHNLACVGDTAFITLESLLDDLLGGEGSAAALDRRVNFRGDAA